MFERFDYKAKGLWQDAIDEAKSAGAREIAAEHILIAAAKSPDASPWMTELGLTEEAIRAAIEVQASSALASIGLTAPPDLAPPTAHGRSSRPRFGSSAKAAVVHAIRFAKDRGDRHVEPAHFIAGVTWAEYGTVPRTLEALDVERTALRSAAQRALVAQP